ncbi:TadE/TadG family type IV pilus assembly protein [Paenibacillus sp. MMS20-IR301]|uniref:TadE/TadG family type IV pilus assembly protein n=1 Tax=Paenibacillus sp. MMS20-IR301 TaxID=2895946 RepID=UPI0028E6A012|nr:TadE/TadG family type IV pilus assembly protein [Paenibacillus sp. MMS20-IR301]WNS41032.1 TadE/TadG family type IV pilus assembly protein [Paenibacillus sp. MMS20-IR301]
MKQWLRSRGERRDQGSMVVEAALVLPVFLLFILFLIFIVQMTLYSTALQSTASDTVKMISTHVYPAALAAQQWNGADQEDASTKETSNSSSVWSVPRLSLSEWSESFVEELPQPMETWVRAAVREGEGPLQKLQAGASETVLDLALKPVLKPYLSSDWLEYSRIHVSNVTVPDLNKGIHPYFGLVVSYDLPMRVPFLNQKIVLEASAVERLWIGNSDAAGGSGTDEPAEESGTIIILEKPNPGVANRQGIIKVKVPPGASANLSIFYKSGQSTAKYLGWKQADENGYIEWEWKIGVNTTPGTWSFVITLGDGTTLEATFTVIK